MVDLLEKIFDALLTNLISVQQEHIERVKRSDGTDSFMFLKT
jgi:hypothetical protein